jgi:aspartate aminotransferase-like enzyme
MDKRKNRYVPLTREEFNTLTGGLSRLLSTREVPVIIPGEAVLGIEAVAAGISAPGRKILNLVTGPYGTLFGKWLRRGGAEVQELRSSFDEVMRLEDVAAAIDRYNPQVLAFVQTEAVTGGANPAKEILELAGRTNIITVLDAVSAIGAEPVITDAWGIDFVIIGPQKAIAGPNGISTVGISERGWAFLESNPQAPRNSILSLLDLRSSGRASFQVPPHIPTLEARALIEALGLVEAEGLENLNRRHHRASESAVAGIKALGLEPWQRDPKGYAPLVTTVRMPRDGSADIETPLGIVAPGDGELCHKLLRINHFGHNACREAVEDAIAALGTLSRRDSSEGLAAAYVVWAKTDTGDGE